MKNGDHSFRFVKQTLQNKNRQNGTIYICAVLDKVVLRIFEMYPGACMNLIVQDVGNKIVAAKCVQKNSF